MAEISVSVERAAELLDLSPTTVRQYVDQGLIPTVQFPSAAHAGARSRRVHILVADLHAFAERHRSAGRTPDVTLSQTAIATWRKRRGA